MHTPKDQIAKEYRVRPPAATNSDEALILELVREVNQICVTHAPEFISTNAQIHFAHPEFGIVLAPAKLAELRYKFEPRQWRKVLMFVLAHELSHWRVLRSLPLKQVATSDKTRVAESQADLLALEIMFWSVIQEIKAGNKRASFEAEI